MRHTRPGEAKSILDFETIERYVKLRMLNNVVRPARRVESAEVVAFTERQLDATLARGFRELLKRFDLTPARAPTSFGMMHYYDSAPGSRERPILLLHGIGSSGQCFALLGAMLRFKRRVVMPDLFHFCGFSEPNNPVMNHAQHTASIAEFIEGLKCAPVDFVGLSLGGWIGMRLAAQRPDLVATLALLNPGGLNYNPYALRDTLMYLSWAKFHAVYPGIFRAPPYNGIPLVSRVLKRSVFRLLKEDAVRDFIKTVEADDFVDHLLPKIAARTLLLWGREDRFLSSETPLAIARAIPACEAYYVERCAHILCLEAPLNVYRGLDRFLGLASQPDSPFTRWVEKTCTLFPMEKIEP